MIAIDHIELAVSDVEASERFYLAALGHLGLERIIDIPPERTRTATRRVGLGSAGYPSLWLHGGERVGEGTHLAFAAENREAVDQFHRAALAAGGRDHGPSGIRRHYHDGYYAAYVTDPDGINLEVVFQARA
ncbi:MAG: glyoxalase/bleomycin resistance/extradiol dioxygenase family protein [Rhodanobacter denitrificans]|uniref:Glyoxalase/bleomycin resistance/extradiol dioxygenase family protein n=1 Tax=Rhodanobacter denitrificans TaxID=666685 RepID=A0A2W5KSC4_9GAMM|nr:MAG: glyoxalase/bleomycin resistance/extradiol dioxygenase family protein [Rhodanobacter denitrificans]